MTEEAAPVLVDRIGRYRMKHSTRSLAAGDPLLGALVREVGPPIVRSIGDWTAVSHHAAPRRAHAEPFIAPQPFWELQPRLSRTRRGARVGACRATATVACDLIARCRYGGDHRHSVLWRADRWGRARVVVDLPPESNLLPVPARWTGSEGTIAG